jgi:hypothetical protein
MSDRPNQNAPEGASVPCAVILDAGSIGPSVRRYRVTWSHGHSTLNPGDIVVMVESPEMRNWLLREPDMTLHSLMDKHDQYVHLEDASNR